MGRADQAFPAPEHRQPPPAYSGLTSAGTLGDFDRGQLPGTLWTTDGRLRLTFVQSPVFDRLEVSPDRLIGCSLVRLVADDDHEHALVEAHRAALDGAWSPVELAWGRHRITGVVGPLRSRAGTVVGCIGLAHAEDVRPPAADRLDDQAAAIARRHLLATCRDLLSRREPPAHYLPAVLALLCREFEWSGAGVWTCDPDSTSLTHLASHHLAANVLAGLEPVAWRTARERRGAETFAGTSACLPLMSGDRPVGVLAMTGDPEVLDATPMSLAPVTELLAAALGQLEEPAGRFAAARRRLRLAIWLAPAPFMLWAC